MSQANTQVTKLAPVFIDTNTTADPIEAAATPKTAAPWCAALAPLARTAGPSWLAPGSKHMTRINCVPVQELHDKHLLAEYRELPRVFKLAAAAHARGLHPAQLPQIYTLGKGHVKFFYTRLGWLKWRFQDIVAEMQRRGFKPQYPQVPNVADGLPVQWWQFWDPTPEALAINRQRIQERLPAERR